MNYLANIQHMKRSFLSAETQTQVTSIEQLCMQLENAPPETIEGVLPIIESILISSTQGDSELAAEIIDCLRRVFGVE
jgi:hypothetical protein